MLIDDNKMMGTEEKVFPTMTTSNSGSSKPQTRSTTKDERRTPSPPNAGPELLKRNLPRRTTRANQISRIQLNSNFGTVTMAPKMAILLN